MHKVRATGTKPTDVTQEIIKAGRKDWRKEARVSFRNITRPTRLVVPNPPEVDPKRMSPSGKGERNVSTKAPNGHPTRTRWTSFLS